MLIDKGNHHKKKWTSIFISDGENRVRTYIISYKSRFATKNSYFFRFKNTFTFYTKITVLDYLQRKYTK